MCARGLGGGLRGPSEPRFPLSIGGDGNGQPCCASLGGGGGGKVLEMGVEDLRAGQVL